MRRLRTLVAALVSAGALTVSAPPPASAGVVVWSTTCPAPDPANPGAGMPGLMEVQVRKYSSTQWILETKVAARCMFVVERSLATRPVGASTIWSIVLSDAEYKDMCAGRTVGNMSGGVHIDTDSGPEPGGIPGIEIIIDGTGAELVVEMKLHDDEMILMGRGAFEQHGSLDCGQDPDPSDSVNPQWKGAIEIWDPAVEE